MNKKEAIELLKGSWFVNLEGGKHTQVEVAQALALAEKCFDEAKPYKAKAKALKAENKALEMENKALREELLRHVSCLKSLFGNIKLEDFNDPTFVTIHISVPREEYMGNVDPLETDPRYTGEAEDEENRG